MKSVGNWLDRLVKVACDKVDHKQDHRFRPWAKVVTGVDMTQPGGYAFGGSFIGNGTTELEIGPTVFLVMTSSGSRRYQRKYYNVLVMDSDGNLSATDIETTDATPGWALRIREDVAKLLESMSVQR